MTALDVPEALNEFERTEYAFYYIKHGSIALDVEILLRTIRANFKEVKSPA